MNFNVLSHIRNVSVLLTQNIYYSVLHHAHNMPNKEV